MAIETPTRLHGRLGDRALKKLANGERLVCLAAAAIADVECCVVLFVRKERGVLSAAMGLPAVHSAPLVTFLWSGKGWTVDEACNNGDDALVRRFGCHPGRVRADLARIMEDMLGEGLSRSAPSGQTAH